MKLCARGLEPLDEEATTCAEHGAPALAVDCTSGDPRVGTRAAGRYVITGVIARGGMGVVYAAHHETLARDVALKVLEGEESRDPEFVARFAREAKLTAALRSPHVVEVYDAGQLDSGELYLAMARLPGRSLEDAAREGWPVERVLDAATQLARALADAHRAGVVHRDLKPSNVIVRADGHVTVIDLGLARRLDARDVALTRTDQLYGTPAFMPPEQWDEAAGELTPAADVYMFGATVFQLATGQRCFTAKSLPGLMRQHLYEPPPSLSRWAEQRGVAGDRRWNALDALVARCLAKRPEERYASGVELLAALEGTTSAALEGTTAAPPLDEPPPTVPLTAPPRAAAPRRSRAPWILAALASMGAVGAWSVLGPRPLSVGPTEVIGTVDRAALTALAPIVARCGDAVEAPATLFLTVEPAGAISSVEVRPRSSGGAAFTRCATPALQALRWPLSAGALAVVRAELVR